MLLIQIVPSILPKVDGIGDHALELARQLRARHGILSAFLVCGDPSWEGGPVERFAAGKIADRTYSAFCDALGSLQQQSGSSERTEVLLHFSPYGYEKRGVPFWFVRILERWNGENQGRLHLGFHELENRSSNPRSSVFWLSRLQRSLCDRVARLGRYKYTNTEPYRHRLEQSGAGRVYLNPSFSTLGEPEAYPAWAQRQKQLVVFGRKDQRREAYGRGGQALAAVCRQAGLRTIVDIGERFEIDRTHLDGIRVEQCGRLPAGEVVQWMSQSVGSFLSYPVPLLTKSSIYAVSCAFGAVPFVHDPDALDLSCTGTLPDRDYVPLGRRDSRFPELDLEKVSEQAFANYKRRNSQVAAEVAARQIFLQPTKAATLES